MPPVGREPLEFCELLGDLVAERNVGIDLLASKINVGASYVYMWLQCRRVPPLEFISPLAAALSLDEPERAALEKALIYTRIPMRLAGELPPDDIEVLRHRFWLGDASAAWVNEMLEDHPEDVLPYLPLAKVVRLMPAVHPTNYRRLVSHLDWKVQDAICGYPKWYWLGIPYREEQDHRGTRFRREPYRTFQIKPGGMRHLMSVRHCAMYDRLVQEYELRWSTSAEMFVLVARRQAHSDDHVEYDFERDETVEPKYVLRPARPVQKRTTGHEHPPYESDQLATMMRHWDDADTRSRRLIAGELQRSWTQRVWSRIVRGSKAISDSVRRVSRAARRMIHRRLTGRS